MSSRGSDGDCCVGVESFAALQAALKRYYVCGLREVCKAIKAGKAVAVLLAPNIEQNTAEGGLNDSVQDIITACSASDIPIVFALSRKKMGEVYGFRKRMSAIALLDVSSVHETMAQVLQLAADGRRQWAVNNPEKLAAAAAAAVVSEMAAALGGTGSHAGSSSSSNAAAVAPPAVSVG
jgi:ribosomal protein L7Ae-like RNA K-turn-binding protein